MSGNASRAAGKAFEDVLDLQHRIYRTQGRAVIYHNRTAGRFITRESGKTDFVPERESRPDYSGTIAPHGRAVHFDAKTVADDVFALRKENRHQWVALWEQAQVGALAFFLVEHRPLNQAYILTVDPTVPVNMAQDQRFLPRASLVAERSDWDGFHTQILVRQESNQGTYDWQAALWSWGIGR